MRASVKPASLLALLLSGLTLYACEELDPVRVEDLCSGEGVISANCSRCMTPPFAPQCPQCQGDDIAAECTGSSTSPATGSDASMPAQPTSGSDAPAGNSSGPSAGKNGSAGASGGGTPAMSGAGGMSMPAAGAGGTSEPRCVQECRPMACRLDMGVCVECVDNKTCSGQICDLAQYVCVECLLDEHCSSGACVDKHCVPCSDHRDCLDTKIDTCAANKCVDCADDHGCDDDPNKPVCLRQGCVECNEDKHCTRDANHMKCLPRTNTCVECVARDGDCMDPDRPVCEIDSNKCVQCLEDGDCEGGARCWQQQCVQCIEDVDCKTPGAARCSANHECTKCSASAQCKHLSATPACDTASGMCVPCVDDSTCGEFSCVRSTKQCGTVKRGTVAPCGTCAADTECGASMKCVEMQFPNAAAAKHCIYNRQLAGSCASSANLRLRPYSRTLQATSVDNAAGPYCAPPKTCEALRDATTRPGGKICPNNASCGLGVGDAICSPFPDGSSGCTYVCAKDEDCLRRCDTMKSTCAD